MGDNSPSQGGVQKLVAGKNCFKGSAIRGSSLLNTIGDIRPFVQRGSTVLVNGVSYEISMTGDWNSNSVQLTADYVGETNFDVSIIIPTASFSPKRKKGGTAKDGALSHASLVQSMEQLNSITEAFNVKLKLQDDSIGKPSKNLKSHRPRAPSKPKTIQMASVDTTGSESTNTKMPYLRPKSSKRTVQNTAAQTANVVEEDAYGDVQQKPEVIKPATLKPVKFTAGSEQSKPAFPTSAHLGRSEPTNRLDDNKKSGAPAPSVHRQQKGTSTGPRGESTEAAQDTQPCSAATAVASVATTEKTIDEQRKAAALRVQRKLKEEQARIEKIEAAKAEALRLQQEASAAKAKELQARTALRVGKYVEENQRRAEQQKQAELYEQQQREQRNQEFFNSSRHAKMKEYRKAARNRLELIAQADYRKAVEEEESVQKKLFEIHKKYEANTTFLPRLDAQSQVSGAGSGVGVIDEKKMKPGVVVKSIGVELEQFERESGKFPEEPVLRSRSARQASRISKAGAAAAVGGCPAISAQYRQNSVPSVPTVINKTLASSAATDDDDWSDDEPDPLLRGKENFLNAPRNINNNGYTGGGGEYDDDGGSGCDEDSLLNQGREPDYDNDFDNAMEREIFGHLPKGKSQNIPPASSLPAPCKMPFVSSKVPTPGVVFQTPQPASSKRTPAVAALTNRGTDGYVSDGSDITIDSMLGGGGGRSMNKCSKSARGGPKRSVMKDSNRPGQVTSKARQQPLQQPPLQQSSAAHQTMAAAPQQQVLYQQARAPPQPQAATNTSSRAAILPHQSSAILSGGSPPLLPCEAKSQQGNYEYTKSGGSGSNFSSSPSKPKVKNVFKKLKPIPISSPYRPIINPVV